MINQFYQGLFIFFSQYILKERVPRFTHASFIDYVNNMPINYQHNLESSYYEEVTTEMCSVTNPQVPHFYDGREDQLFIGNKQKLCAFW